MISMEYRFRLELFTRELNSQGEVKNLRSLGQIDVDPPFFRSAQEWCHFQGIREEALEPFTAPGSCAIEPVWDEQYKEPVVAAFRTVLRGCADEGFRRSLFGREYFRPLALSVARSLISRGDIESVDQIYFRVLAVVPDNSGKADGPEVRFNVESIPQPLKIGEKDVAPLQTGTAIQDPRHENPELDLPVFIPRALFDEAFILTRQAGSRETGGVLIGCLNRDPETRAVFLEVTAQIPARYSKSELQRLTFTADTWTAVKQAVELRGRDELWVGWWHSHSYLKETCADCERKDDGSCRSSALFLSDEDCTVHKTIFNPAYSVALVISDSPCSGLEHALFGWRDGMLVRRAYNLAGGGPESNRRRGAEMALTGEITERKGGSEHVA